jgi:AcrR family transcriptional regulator
MIEASSRDAVLAAARRLFAERGYQHVTVRQIAAEAGVSPALVMKLGGSKRDLYDAASPPEFEPLQDQWPRARFGAELVRRVLERRDAGTVEPWISALLAVQDSPDPVAARREFASHHIARLRRRIDSGDHDQVAAEAVSALLIGLAVAPAPSASWRWTGIGSSSSSAGWSSPSWIEPPESPSLGSSRRCLPMRGASRGRFGLCVPRRASKFDLLPS